MCVISLYGIQLYNAARFHMAVLFSDVHTKFLFLKSVFVIKFCVINITVKCQCYVEVYLVANCV